MATPRTPNQKKQYTKLNARLAKYGKLIEQLYEKYNREAAKIAMRTAYDPEVGDMFQFKDYPITRDAISKLMEEYMGDMVATINRTTSKEWQNSNEFQDLLVNKVLKSYGVKDKNGEEYQKYYQANPDHLKAFQNRTINGMNLSHRVWNLKEQYKQELEMGLSVGIEKGSSATSLAKELKQYLKDPDKLFRRVRDKYGNLQLSKNAKAYHPGRGVYRSSYKNALRLTRSETNMAYRTAEQTRWRQFDFVVGYEIKLSQSHPCHDVCDTLAGKYPKDFVWTGWHPMDMCYCVSILKTDEEFASLDDNPSVNEVADVPDEFKDWVRDNADRIETAEKRGTQPYFIRDNKEYIQGILKPGEGESDKNIGNYSQEIKENIWTEEYVKEIQRAGIFFRDKDELIERMSSSPFAKLDIVQLDSDIRMIMTRHGFGECDISGKITVQPNGDVSLDWSDLNNRFLLNRKFFIDSEGRKVVDHHLFQLSSKLQGLGISKKIFQSLYRQYKATGVERLEVFANIDVGGYTWARYGFCVKKRSEVISAIRFSALTQKQEKKIMEIIDAHFSSSSAPFPMHKIAKLPYGKKALLGGCWDGVLDLFDDAQRSTFERYLRR